MSSWSRPRPDRSPGRSLAAVICLLGVGLTGGAAASERPGRSVPAAGYYVAPAPHGRATGSGSETDPWDLATALAGGRGRIGAGDTIWMRGGTYAGAFRTALEGAPGRWIVFRQYPGERATIDGTLRADGAYLAFWGFEVMQSTPATYGVQANTDHGKFINLVVHDAGTQGVSFWTPAVDAELYGCIVYDNGTHENLDHGTYVHNETGTKLIADNVFFNNLARGIQIYASPKNPVLRNVRVEGNVSFDNGTISTAVTARENLIFNAPVPTEGMVAIGNLLYFATDRGINLRLGKYAPQNNRDVVLQGNYIAGGRTGIEMEEPWQHAVVSGNEVVGSRDVVRVGGASLTGHYQWTDNTWVRDPAARAWRYAGTAYTWDEWRRATHLGEGDRVVADRPASARVFVRPNRYEPGRATIVVYNWGGADTVAVEPGVLHPGDRYQIHNVQALFAAPVVSGVYAGGPLHIPMGGVAPPTPIGRVLRPAPRTGPAFDVFLLTTASR
jgi:hypothetical protein